MLRRGYATVRRPSIFLWLSGMFFSHRLEYFENNFTIEYLKVPAHTDPNSGDLVQREHPQIGWN